ncbi:hypothetical protein ACFVU0_14505 [Streptomyces sp. NPDC058122]|uniref:hypothetical protein n=1 Tax=Streptomyces sp. NPDC058122 TaxID=3346349 RepID=UPI0036E0DAD6
MAALMWLGRPPAAYCFGAVGTVIAGRYAARRQVGLGVWLTNAKTRRAKLTAATLATLTDLGLDWAAGETAA